MEIFKNHSVWRRHNYKNLELSVENVDSGDQVEVVVKDSQQRFFGRWMGFMTRDQAKESGGISVKLIAFKVDGVELDEGEYVQGCLIGKSVYFVVDTIVSVVSSDGRTV